MPPVVRLERDCLVRAAGGALVGLALQVQRERQRAPRLPGPRRQDRRGTCVVHRARERLHVARRIDPAVHEQQRARVGEADVRGRVVRLAAQDVLECSTRPDDRVTMQR